MDVNGLATVIRAGRRRAPVRRGRAARALLGFLGLYLGGAAVLGGHAAGARLAGMDPAAAGALLWRLPLALGISGALWDGGCLVQAAPWRPFFVAPGTLAAAEAALALATPVKRVLAALGLLFTLGLAWGRPGLVLPGLLGTGLLLVWTACLERVIHVLAPAGVFRQRGFLAVLLGLAAVWLGLGALAGAPRPALPPGLERLWALPGIHMVRFAQAPALRHLAVPLAATAGLVVLTGLCLRLEWGRERRAGAALAGGRVWRLGRPWLGVARLHLHQLLGSRAGQLRLLLTVAVVALAKEPELLTVGTLHTPAGWVAGAAAFNLGCVLMVPLANLFGLDRGGVRTWWSVPVADRDLLLGKVAGCAAYAALAGTVLVLLSVRIQAWHLGRIDAPGSVSLTLLRSGPGLGALRLAALTVLLAALFLWWAGTGLGTSLRAPYPIGRTSYAAKFDFDEQKLERLGQLLAPLAWMLPCQALAGLAGPGWVLAQAGVLAGIAGWRFRRRLAAAAADLAERREALTLALS